MESDIFEIHIEDLRNFRRQRMHSPHPPLFSANSDVRIPAEFEPQDSIVLGCGQLIRSYPQTFVDLVTALHERVTLFGVVAPSIVRLGEILLGTAGLPKDAISFFPKETSAMWVRDYSPITALDRSGRRVFLKFQQSHMRNRDDLMVADSYRQQFEGAVRNIEISLEGGNLISNGAGFSLSSKTIISQNASRFDHAQLASILDRRAGVGQWACTVPLNGERTGHIDLLATFLKPNLVGIAEPDAGEDPNNLEILDDLARALSGYETGSGKLEVVRVPMPSSRDTHFRSYNNVIFANGLVVLPGYPRIDPKQALRVRDMYSEWLPGYEIVMVDCDEVSLKGGSLHCLTTNIVAESPVRRYDRSISVPSRDEVLPR